jgi:dTDP-glucose 4,6-dehydratase
MYSFVFFMKTILITGCAGFIGSHLTDYFLNNKYKVIGIDNLITGLKSNIQIHLTNNNFNFFEHDICNYLDIEDKIDYILHFASPASPKHYLKYPIETLKTGSIGTENVLNLALKNKATVLVASTSEIYGDPLQHPQTESYFGNVNPVGPRAVYDEAKRYLEAITTAYSNKKQLDVRIVRIFNTYGPRMRKDDGRVIPNFINQALNNENFTVFGDGTQTRSFCYIDDLIIGIDNLLKSKYKYPINIGNSNEISINQLLKLIKSLVTTKSKVIFSKFPQNDPKVRKPDISLAKKILDWEPKTSLFDGLIKTIDYFSKNEKN